MADPKMIGARKAEMGLFYRQNQDAFRAAKEAFMSGGDSSALKALRQKQQAFVQQNRPEGGYKQAPKVEKTPNPNGSPWADRTQWQQFRQENKNPGHPMPPVPPPPARGGGGPTPTNSAQPFGGPQNPLAPDEIKQAFGRLDSGEGAYHFIPPNS